MAKQDKLQKMAAEAVLMERRAQAVAGIPLTSLQCRDLVAVVYGFADWSDAQRQVVPPPPLPAKELDRQASFAGQVARQFLEAANRARQHRVVDDRFVQAVIPAVVLAAFSIELGLKAIHICEMRKPIAGHDLGVLVRAISPASRTTIENLTPTPMYPAYDPPRTFLESVDAAGLAFVDWRYPHEAGKFLMTDLDFLVSMATACLKVCDRLMPVESAPRNV